MRKRHFAPSLAAGYAQKISRSNDATRSRFLAALLVSSTWLAAVPVLAAGPAPGTVIDNQATGSFVDSTDNTEKVIESNTVSVTVAEVAGITITSTNTPNAIPGGVANFEFTVTNVGNDPTQFFIPSAPSSTTGGTAGTLKIIAYDPDGIGPLPAVDLTANNITVPSGGATTGVLLGAIAAANNGVIPPDATIVVQIPVTVTAADGDLVSATLGNTSGQPSASNTPYVVGANGTGGQDVYTVDNADNVAGEAPGIPLNGDAVNRRQEASATNAVTAIAVNVTVSGLVFTDANGNITINGSDTGTNAGSANLTVYAIDATGQVIDKATVAADGTYSLANVPVNSSVTLRLSNDASVAIGATAPTSSSLPTGWINTGENKNGVTETTTLGDIAITTTNVNINNQNFGIEQLPNSTNLTALPQTNPGGTATVQVPTLAGTDPEDGSLGSGQSFQIVTLPTNGTLYYDGVAITTAGQVISNYNPSLLRFDPTDDGPTTVSFTYAAIDAAGQADPTPATVTMPLTGKPNLLLVKRITAINGNSTGRTVNGTDIDLSQFVNDPNTTDDNNSNWTSGYLTGAIDGGVVKNGDELEYTIYFLSNGTGTAQNVLLCDRIPDNTTFLPTGFNSGSFAADPAGLPGADRGIVLSLGLNGNALSNVGDSDRAQFFPAGVEPNTVFPNINCGGPNTTGAVVVNIGDVVNATAPGTPNTSYGFLRFRATVR